MISHLKKILWRFKNIYKGGKISVMNPYIPFSLLQHYQERAKLLSFLHFSLAFVFLKYITSLTFIEYSTQTKKSLIVPQILFYYWFIIEV